jgi:hypothetical protein
MARKKKKSSARAKPAKKRRATPKRKPVKLAPKKKTAKKPAKARNTKPAARKAARKPARREILGEGNYTASRNFREQETAFVTRNRSRIGKMGKEAEAALEGPEGKDLMAAEEQARAHSHALGAE